MQSRLLGGRLDENSLAVHQHQDVALERNAPLTPISGQLGLARTVAALLVFMVIGDDKVRFTVMEAAPVGAAACRTPPLSTFTTLSLLL